MDKLTRYNQKLLAVIGTTVLVITGLAVLIGIGGFIISLIASNDTNNTGVIVQDNPKIESDSSEYIRVQEISFGSPIQLDSAQSKYLISVGQVNLETPENVEFEPSRSYNFSKVSYPSRYGLFNNFVYTDFSNNTNEKIFDYQVALTRWVYIKQDSNEAILFKGTSSDDNNDKQMNSNDYQSIFAFYLDDLQLIEYHFENQTVIKFKAMEKTNLVSIQLGIDKNKDFEFDSSTEPQVITSLNLSSRKIEKLVSPELQSDIQKIIDGIN